MNKNTLFICGLLMVSAVTFHWIMRDNTSSKIVSTFPLKKSHPSPKQDPISPLKTVFKKNIDSQKKPESQRRQDIPQELSTQFSLLSKAYANDIVYPSYSMPLLSSDLNYLEPNHFSVVNIPVLDGTHTASLSLKKYRFDYPEPIVVTLNSDLAVDHIEYELLNPETRKSLTTQYTQELTTSFTAKKEWPQEIRIKATITFLNGKDIITTDIQFSNPVAYVESINAPYSAGSNMILPLNVNTKQPGNYRIRANLYLANGKPIASLTHKTKLSTGNSIFELKAHHSVLKGIQGELELRNITVEKMSDFPGEKTRYGASKEAVFLISSFDLSGLSDEPYEIPKQDKERLQFLNDIAQQNE